MYQQSRKRNHFRHPGEALEVSPQVVHFQRRTKLFLSLIKGYILQKMAVYFGESLVKMMSYPAAKVVARRDNLSVSLQQLDENVFHVIVSKVGEEE